MSQRSFAFLALAALASAAPSRAQQAARPDSTLLTVDRIFAGGEFRSASLRGVRWLPDGTSYLTVEDAPQGQRGQQIIRVDARTGDREVLVPASRLVPPASSIPM